jgi:hypothetical protein
MRSMRVEGRVAAALMAVVGFGAIGPVAAATGEGEAPQIAQARAIGEVADLTLRFIQEDGPESGHVRVVLTPEARPLTVIEARMAAEQAFLQALKEPGLGDKLKRITVVVRLMPDSHPNPDAAEQVVVYLHKGGRDWSVLPGN